jgi:hypothetical protein
LSTGVPPTSTNFSVTVPAGNRLIVVVHTTNPGEVACTYRLTVRGNLCALFDVCVEDDMKPPLRFIKLNTLTGAYTFTDCSKNLTLSGKGVAKTYFCKSVLFDKGSKTTPNRFVSVQFNPCTGTGDVIVQFGAHFYSFHDSDINNNTCECPPLRF